MNKVNDMPRDDQTGIVAMHPSARALIDQMIALAPEPLYQMTPPEARAAFDDRHSRLVRPAISVGHTVSRRFPGAQAEVPVRLYYPVGAADEDLPVLVYFHGGGWVIGNLETVDALCHDLCAQAQAVVVSVDYRLAPEHPFPAAIEDGQAVLDALRAEAGALRVDARRIFVAGDSAGGNIAASLALIEADAGHSLAGQVLIYPVTDVSTTHSSMLRFASGLNLDAATMQWFGDCYLPDPEMRSDWRASPLLARMTAPPAPALVVTAGYDPLLDEGAAYATRLASAGTPVEYLCFATQIHGFATQTAVSSEGYLLRDVIAGFLRRHRIRG
ncbi:alpha/beta hydrolase [Paracoccus sp. (in: a-proteobacteria)]|uniref:alpha/beta hydrolase n=1 Tax=Paracoccus sp. TaxID=267 RepID=UPI003A86D5BD